MQTNSNNLTLDQFAESIAKWGVGIVAGSGLSTAVVGEQAKNWKELFVELLAFLKFDSTQQELPGTTKDQREDEAKAFIEGELSMGNTLPQVASKIVSNYANDAQITILESRHYIKRAIQALVNWVPNRDVAEKYETLFNQLHVDWIITTNYDEVLETIFGEKGFSINPDQAFVAPNDKIPIYHVHGSRRDPYNLIVVQEDYVPLFRPGEYRENKLTTMMTEKPMLILGYSLSDMNLLAAVDQSSHAPQHEGFKILLTNFTDSPAVDIVESENGYYTVDINSLTDFLTMLGDKVKQIDTQREENRIVTKLLPFTNL